jgi:SAM-dependent methyltransferase
MTGDDPTRRFYDQLAPDYHLIFADWDASIERQQAVLERVLREFGVAPPSRVLDCAAGIGTQAIGLARAGYTVTATDISGDAVARGRAEAAARSVTIDWAVADMRALGPGSFDRGSFDAVVCCDNALPHLLTDDDLRAALAGVRRALRPGGAFVATIRDYDDLLTRRPTGTEPQLLRDEHGRRRVVGQAWQWDGDEIEVALYVLQEAEPEWTATVRTMRYRALPRAVLTAALETAGFDGVRWFMPAESGYYQPLVTACAPAA